MNRRSPCVISIWAGLNVVVLALAANSASGAAPAKQEDAGNLVQNSSFEAPAVKEIESTNVWDRLPDGWDIFNSHSPTVTLASGLAHQGDQGVKLGAQGKRNGNVGMFQIITVEPGHEYKFSMNVMNDPTEPIKGSGYGELTLEWQDASGEEISRERSKSWGPSLPKNDWKKMLVKGKSPANAVAARIVVTLFDGPNPSKGAFWVDDVEFTGAQ